MTQAPSTPASVRSTARSAVPAFAADVACVLIFVTLGRRNHSEAVTVAGVAHTAGPFLFGLVIAWLQCRAWRRPTAVRPTGLTVWVGTVAIGMAVRAAFGGGVAVSFVLVATLVTGALLVGWRAVTHIVTRTTAKR